MAEIGHSESIWTILVGKYWKTYKMFKIGHSESIWTTSVGKYWKSCKTAKINILLLKWSELIQNGQFWPLFQYFPTEEKLQNV